MRVAVVTGASGGHIHPALAFLDACGDTGGVAALLVLPRLSAAQQQVVERGAYTVRHIAITPFGRGRRCFVSALRLLWGAFQSLRVLWTFRPHIVVAFGTIVSIPLVVFARLSGVKVLLHEQNVLPGRANRLMSFFCDRVAVSFEQTGQYLPAAAGKVVLTGNPLRKGLRRVGKQEALDFFGLGAGKITVAVMGGSQGSRGVNTAFLAALAALCRKRQFEVIHLSGAADLAFVKEAYAKLAVRAAVFAFLEDMQYVYCASDFIVSRSGATSVAEMMFFSTPAILVPYPHACEHQAANAAVLEQAGCAVVVRESADTAKELTRAMDELAGDPARVAAMRSRYVNLPQPEAAAGLLEAALDLGR